MDGITEAVMRAKSQQQLASRLNVTKQSVQQYVAEHGAPPERAVQIEEATGIHRFKLVKPGLRQFIEEGMKTLKHSK